MGKASTIAKNKYNLKAYDRINLTIPKGRKADIQAVAEEQGESINGYIKKAVAVKYAADTGKEIEL